MWSVAVAFSFTLLLHAPCEADPQRGRARIAQPAPAEAQAPTPVGMTATAVAERPLPRFDVAGFIGWRGVRVDVDGSLYSYSLWDSRLLLGGTFGYYWTTHLKTEAEVGRTTDSHYWNGSTISVPRVSSPVFVRTDHRAVDTLVTGRVLYQFGENDWVHPFVGAGVSLEHTRDRREIPRQTTYVQRQPGLPSEEVVIASPQTSTVTSHDAAGELIAGVKLYSSEHAFFRTDLTWALRPDRDHRVSWRIGAGWDF